MARLGEFGAAKREADPARERDTFTLCGVEFLVAEEMDTLAMLEFAEAAAGGLDDDDPRGQAAILSLIRSAVDEADWPKFRATVRRHRPKPEVLMDLAMAFMQWETGRPTTQPSDSSDGLSTTGENSKASSPLGAIPPIQLDPRVQALVPVESAALSLVG